MLPGSKIRSVEVLASIPWHGYVLAVTRHDYHQKHGRAVKTALLGLPGGQALSAEPLDLEQCDER